MVHIPISINPRDSFNTDNLSTNSNLYMHLINIAIALPLGEHTWWITHPLTHPFLLHIRILPYAHEVLPFDHAHVAPMHPPWDASAFLINRRQNPISQLNMRGTHRTSAYIA